MFKLLRTKMGTEEESKWWLSLRPMEMLSNPQDDETSYARSSPPTGPPRTTDAAGEARVPPYVRTRTIWGILSLWIWCSGMLASAAWIVSKGTAPKTSGIVLPWAAYIIAWVGT